MFILKNNWKMTWFAGWASVLNLLLFHWPFFHFVFQHVDHSSMNGMIILVSLLILMLLVNFFVFFIIFSLSQWVGRVLLVLFFILNSIAVYFINTYGIIIDESMVGNVFNTNFEESSSFFSIKLIVYILILGVLPSVYILRATLEKSSWKSFFKITSLSLLLIVSIAFANSKNWLWIDKNSKTLGGLAMPWSYSVNTYLHHLHEYQKNKKEILLPNAFITDSSKSIVVLVIGESARSNNFSLYGYEKNTNPLLSQTKNLFHFKAKSCATYTTAGIKCILEHTSTDELYEILPNYLYRNNVEVIWRSTNWGEPPVHIKNYQGKKDLQRDCLGDSCNYDAILLKGLQEQIESSSKNKLLVVLHSNTSHGPTYSKRYPPQFEIFKPVCNSVELSNCSNAELMNAYDNTIVYTDYLLHQIIEKLKQMPQYNSCMLFVSDHGESLGEKNLYMHGVPISIAPREQYEIPFLVWLSEHNPKQLKSLSELSQNHVFHSVLDFLGIQSPVYKEDMSIFK
ncbi:MAG: phosphoethanolamine--lipid A transferase EptA [Ferruginibacter sp.]|nr:phosphoethanolamine--lipid A transferase EptA [Ferruginibacter sp.]